MASTTRRIDWPALMRAGLNGLRLHPRDFWALTPLELMVMLGREGADPGFSRTSLEALMTRFPDVMSQSKNGGLNDRS